MNKKILGLIAAAVLGAPMSSEAVVVGSYDWRQVTDTVGISWNQLTSVCDESTGACSGSLNGVSFDGWTWADRTAVHALFEELISPSTIEFPTPLTYFSRDNPYIDAALSETMFQPTGGIPGEYERLVGWTRTSFDASVAFTPLMNNNLGPNGIDVAQLDVYGPKHEPLRDVGAWLYRPAPTTSVPEPGTLALLGIALVGFAAARRRRNG